MIKYQVVVTLPTITLIHILMDKFLLPKHYRARHAMAVELLLKNVRKNFHRVMQPV